MSRVGVRVKELHAQAERLRFSSGFLGVPPLPRRLNPPHVVEDVQLGGRSSSVNYDQQEAQFDRDSSYPT